MTGVVTDQDFSNLVEKSSGVVVVDFWAEWCGPCKIMTPIFEEASQKFNGKATFLKMNVDENQEIPGKFMIRGIPTFLVFKNGKLFDTKVGGMNKTAFFSWIENILE